MLLGLYSYASLKYLLLKREITYYLLGMNWNSRVYGDQPRAPTEGEIIFADNTVFTSNTKLSSCRIILLFCFCYYLQIITFSTLCQHNEM